MLIALRPFLPGKAQDPFRGKGSRGKPWPQHHLDAASKTSTGAHPRELDRHQLDRGGGGNRQARWQGTQPAFQANHVFLTSLRTTPEALLQLVRDRWSIEGWHWIRDTQLHEDAHRYRGNGAGAMATLRTAALNLLRLAGFQSIRGGMQAVMHDITTLLEMAGRQPKSATC